MIILQLFGFLFPRIQIKKYMQNNLRRYCIKITFYILQYFNRSITNSKATHIGKQF